MHDITRGCTDTDNFESNIHCERQQPSLASNGSTSIVHASLSEIMYGRSFLTDKYHVNLFFSVQGRLALEKYSVTS